MKRIHLFRRRIPDILINYVWTVFLKSREPWAIIIYFMYRQMWNENAQPLLLFFTGDSWNFPYEREHSIAHLIFKICVQGRKDKCKETKMLLKLIVVDSYYFIRDNYKTTPCLDSQTSSEYISTFALDNKSPSINEVLEVLTGAGTFTSASSFDAQGLQFFTISEWKKSMPGVL